MHLPIEFWSPICLSYVASSVGNPLYADSVTGAAKIGFCAYNGRSQSELGFS